MWRWASIDAIEPTLDALLLMESQFQEGGADGHAGLYPDDEAGRQRRRAEVRGNSRSASMGGSPRKTS
jgi:hypothetical protein